MKNYKDEKLAKMTDTQFAQEWERVMNELNPNREVHNKRKKKQSRFMIQVKKEIKNALRKMEHVTVDTEKNDIVIMKGSETIILKTEYL